MPDLCPMILNLTGKSARWRRDGRVTPASQDGPLAKGLETVKDFKRHPRLARCVDAVVF
jgi:hypothetical protein